MCSLRTQSKTIPHALAAMLLVGTIAAAQIPRLCNTGQTAKTFAGCTGALVPPNPPGGGTNRDGNWCSGSSRNAVQLPFGTGVQVRRNPDFVQPGRTSREYVYAIWE